MPETQRSCRIPHGHIVALIAISLTTAGGCGYSGGEALFFSGLFKRPMIEAQFKLGDGAVAIIVDDPFEHCHWPEATTILSEQITKQLKKHSAAKKLIPDAKIKQLRRAYPNFHELSYQKIAKLLEAEQIVAVEVRSFFATLDPTDSNAAAYMSAAVKVIDGRKHTAKSKARLWPKIPSGKSHYAEISAAQVTRANSRSGILRSLTEILAKKIVRNFYERKMDDFEKQ